MSLILDALNKADREREYRDSVPDINTIHSPIRPEKDRKMYWLVGGLILITLVLIGLVLVLWLRNTGATVAAANLAASEMTPAKSNTSKNSSQPGTDQTNAAANEAKASVESNTIAEAIIAVRDTGNTGLAVAGGESARLANIDPEIEALYQPQEDKHVMQVIQPSIKTVDAGKASANANQSAQNSIDAELARVLWEQTKILPADSVPLNEIVPQANARTAQTEKPKSKLEKPALPDNLAPEETLAGHAALPFLHELSSQDQNKIPTLMYAKHEYEKGFVVINKEELHMGHATNGGVVIEKILADGVLLKFNDKVFKLSSLSSWVNY